MRGALLVAGIVVLAAPALAEAERVMLDELLEVEPTRPALLRRGYPLDDRWEVLAAFTCYGAVQLAAALASTAPFEPSSTATVTSCGAGGGAVTVDAGRVELALAAAGEGLLHVRLVALPR